MNPINTSQCQGLFPISHLGKLIKLGFAVIICTIVFSACKTEEPDPPEENWGKIILNFKHQINGIPLEFDTLLYINAAGNPFLVNEIQYFISDISLYYHNGSVSLINDWKAIQYVDTDIPDTQSWEVFDKIPEGTYDSINFTVGIADEKNASFMFVNPPESFMFWPEFLGGGYHYLKLNGKWLEEGQQNQTTPFDFHLGRGQIYYSYPDSITEFIPNEFTVSLPNSGFQINTGQTIDINIIMNIENWFQNPNIYDHNVWGGYIMQNQEAMQLVKENGHNVFSVELAK